MVELHLHSQEIRYARGFDLTVPHVCPDCNHHWMSDMETQTRDIALPLIRGDRVSSLSAADQAQLASWCFLKVISLEIGRPAEDERTYPDAIYTGFRRFKHPPVSSCAVSIGRRDIDPDDPRTLYIWFKSQGQKRTFPALGDLNGYRTALVIGHLVIDVIGIYANVALHLDDDSRLVRIWPAVHPSVDLPSESFVGIRGDDLI